MKIYKSVFLFILTLLVISIISGCSNDRAQISSALYGSLVREVNEMGGNSNIEILDIEIKNNTATADYLLKSSGKQVGGVQTSTLTKENGQWKVDKTGDYKRR